MRDRSAPLTRADVATLAWDKMHGLLPALVQHSCTGEVLMLGYMNEEALNETLASGLATFFSRSRKQLWKKGETSGNILHVRRIFVDCDADALLVLAEPSGPVCHLGTESCFEAGAPSAGWLATLSAIIAERARSGEFLQLYPQASQPRRSADRSENRRGRRRGRTCRGRPRQ